MRRSQGNQLPTTDRIEAGGRPLAPRCIERENMAPAIDLLQFLTKDYAHLLRRLTRRFGSIDFAADALQDVYVRLRTGPLKGKVSRPRAYLYRMAVNRGLNLARRDERSRPLEASLIENFADTAPNSERIVAGINELDFVLQELHKLPGQRKAIFLARWRDEKELAVIAGEFGLHRRTVQKELARTEKHLRVVLDRSVK